MINNTLRQISLYTLVCLLLFLIAPSPVQAKDKIKKKGKHDIEVGAPDTPANMVFDTPLSPGKQPRIITMQKESPQRAIELNINPEGIDVSHYQGTINWDILAQSGEIGYAFVKACESVSFVDNFYQRNMSEGRRVGIIMGSYHFWRAHVNQNAQFEHMISIIKKEEQDLIPIIDVESANGVSPDLLALRLHDFLNLCEQHYGCKPIIYTYVNFYNKYLLGRGFDSYPLFMAYYNSNPPRVNDDRDYLLWQYTSKGRLPGFGNDRRADVNVDRSRFMNGHTIAEILMPGVSPKAVEDKAKKRHQSKHREAWSEY